MAVSLGMGGSPLFVDEEGAAAHQDGLEVRVQRRQIRVLPRERDVAVQILLDDGNGAEGEGSRGSCHLTMW